MGTNSLRKVAKIVIFIFDTLIYAVCISFIALIVLVGAYYAYTAIMHDIILKYYVIGILIMLSLGLSLAYINKYNKKYNINDSNSSKGQNDFLFESDICKEERRYTNRRNVEQ